MAHDILGLENGLVVLARSNSGWSATFKSEASDLNSVMKGRVSGIEHVGSTSIPGIRAKPILDIMVGVLNLTDGIALGPVLAELNYELRPNAGLPGEHVFTKGTPRTHLLHMVEYEGEVWQQKLAFRDALREDTDLALAYEKLKVELSLKYVADRGAYTDGKTEFVRGVVHSRLGGTKFHTRGGEARST